MNNRLRNLALLVCLGAPLILVVHWKMPLPSNQKLKDRSLRSDMAASASINGSRTNNPREQISPPGQAPFVLEDTVTDSPGTNLETRVVTFTARIDGTSPIACQWKVDKGKGFVAVSAKATNGVLIIANARISDTGLYSLFATNALGAIHTTPVPLVVVEAVD